MAEKQEFSVGSSVWLLSYIPDAESFALGNYTDLNSFIRKGTVWCCELRSDGKLTYKLMGDQDVSGSVSVEWRWANELYPSKAAAKREVVTRLLSSLEEREQQINRIIKRIHEATAKLLGETYGDQ